MDAATAKLTSALEVVAHTVNLNRATLERLRVAEALQDPEVTADLGEILAALDTWRDASNNFLATIAVERAYPKPAPIAKRQRCGNLCDCPSPLHHDMAELASKLQHAPVAISRTDIINELDEALTRSTEAD